MRCPIFPLRPPSNLGSQTPAKSPHEEWHWFLGRRSEIKGWMGAKCELLHHQKDGWNPGINPHFLAGARFFPDDLLGGWWGASRISKNINKPYDVGKTTIKQWTTRVGAVYTNSFWWLGWLGGWFIRVLSIRSIMSHWGGLSADHLSPHLRGRELTRHDQSNWAIIENLLQAAEVSTFKFDLQKSRCLTGQIHSNQFQFSGHCFFWLRKKFIQISFSVGVKMHFFLKKGGRSQFRLRRKPESPMSWYLRQTVFVLTQ